MNLDITLEALYKIIKLYMPLVFEEHKKWHRKGYELCTKMIKEQNNTLEANIFAINYYINNFNEEHLYLYQKLNQILGSPYYPGFIAYYDNNKEVLKVIASKNTKIKKNSIITHINKKPFLEYIKEFIIYNNGKKNNVRDYIIGSVDIFFDYKNPYLSAPKEITIDNKIIELKYIPYNNYFNINIFFRENINKNIKNNSINDIIQKDSNIYIKIYTFDIINYDKLKNMLQRPIRKIIVDLRNNIGGLIRNVEDFFKIVYKLNINWGRQVKKSIFTNYIGDITKCKIDDKEKIDGPNLEILVNENSLSACRLFILIAKRFIKEVKINGNINLSFMCGEIMEINKRYYNLILPTYCFKCDVF
jgi:hypothetical protein